jgi:hypothetical protein
VLLLALRDGATIAEAAGATGVSVRTTRRWLCDPELAALVEQARTEADDDAWGRALMPPQPELVGQAQTTAPDDWRQAAAFLELTSPQPWGRIELDDEWAG